MKSVNFYVTGFALVAALLFSSSAIAQDGAFLDETTWLGKKPKETDQMYFGRGNGTSKGAFITLYSADGKTVAGQYEGYWTFSGNTVTIDVRVSHKDNKAPFTIKATVNSAKTEITFANPLGGGNLVFTQQGASTGAKPALEKNDVKKPDASLNRPETVKPSVTSPGTPRK
jgi:hypothetical protein